MSTVLIASTNPVKINSSEQAFKQVFPENTFEFKGTNFPSGVPDQPMGEAETLQGARNRARAARQARPEVDYCVGIEGGLIETDGDLISVAWIVIINKHGQESAASTGTFKLPKQMAEEVRNGLELGAAADKLHGTINVKQGQGTVGLLTHGAINRTDYYVHAGILALIPFKNPELY
jgi:inosine/xanthosine triphosphatase